MNSELYMKRLMKCSVAELVRLRDHVTETRGRRFAAFMLALIASAISAKTGLEVVS